MGRRQEVTDLTSVETDLPLLVGKRSQRERRGQRTVRALGKRPFILFTCPTGSEIISLECANR